MQAVAPLDCLAHLPAPPVKGNKAAASLHAGQLLAYAAASAVVVVDVQRMAVATTLAGAHRQAAVSALAWHPCCGPREPKAAAHVRLASGDEEGRVMVWNVNTGAVIAALEDPWGSAFGAGSGGGGGGGASGGGGKRPEGGRPPVVGVQWATAVPSVLAILLAPCILLLWDYRTGSVIWRKDFSGGGGASEPFTSLQVDPLDRRRLVLCGSTGSFIVLCLTNPAADRVKQQQYQVDLGPGGTLRCSFSSTQDLLFLILQREIIVFDLEYGQPAAATPLPGSRSPLDDMLGCYGHAAAGKPLADGGIDLLYCSHKDGSVSIWQRHARLLTYTCLGSSKLMPSALKFGPAPSLMLLAAGLWRGLEAAAVPSDATADISPLYLFDGKRHPGTARRVSSTSASSEAHVSSGDALGDPGMGHAGGEGSSGGSSRQQQDEEASGRSVLLMGVASDGRVWQWQLPLLGGTVPEPKPAPMPPAPKPDMLGLLHTLPQRVTSFTACPVPVPLPGASGAVTTIAVATAAGSIEIAAVQQGALLPLHLTISTSLAVHASAVQGLRWLGSTPRLASYSTEKVADGFKNTLMITDVRNRVSLPFRQGPADPAPLVGVRASPSGRYLLALFRGGPSEIWAVGGGSQPSRLRQVDLQFTAVEWLPADGQPPVGGSRTGGSAGPWPVSPKAAERAAGGYAFQPDGGQLADDPPEERLAFCLVDGRTGVLGIRGRRISDVRPRRPAWPALAAGDFRAIALGSWGQSVLLGDAEGTLVQWDTGSGRCSVLESGYGKVHKIYASAPPSEVLYPGAPSVQARVAVLFASGVFAAYDLDLQGELRGTHATGSAAAARVGRVTDVEWLPLPAPIGGGTVLAASLEDGSLALFDTVHSMDVRPRRTRMLRYHAALHTPPPPPPEAAVGLEGLSRQPWGLLHSQPVVSAALLPHAWARLLRLLLQRGLPEAAFRELGALAAGIGASAGGGGGSIGRTAEAERALERLEEEVFSRLPRSCQVAWDSLLSRRSDQGEAGAGESSGPALMQILDSFAADTEDEEDDAASVSSAGMGAAAAAVAQRQTSPSWAGSAVRDEAAAAALGLTSRQGSATAAPGGGKRRGDVAQTFKSLGGAFKGMAKDVASASKSQLKSLALAGSGASFTGGGGSRRPLVAAVAGISDGYEHGQDQADFHSLVAVLHAIGTARGQPAVLTPAELAAYSQVLSSRRMADRMAVAAELTGDGAEAQFWHRLPTTLQWLAATLQQARRRASETVERGGSGISGGPDRRRSMEAAAAAFTPPALPRGSAGSGTLPPLAGGTLPASGGASSSSRGGSSSSSRRLWEENLELAEATERSAWHEQMSRRIFEDSEGLQEKRVLEYVALGDFQTAVGFLLASPPDRSQRYYRDALCTLGMAFACGLQQAALLGQSTGGGTMLPAGSGSGLAATATASAVAAVEDSAARTLFVQAAKVITANAASVGDTLLGVPLLCSTGQHADAVNLLQDSGLWRYASALIAHSLRGAERASALERWAGHVAAAEGRPWTAVGLLVAAGALKSALQLLRQCGLPDAAMALVAACKDADLPLQQHNLETGELQNLFAGGQQPIQRFNSAGERLADQQRGGGGGSNIGGTGGEQAPQHQQQGALLRADTLTDYERNETAKEFQLYICEVLQQL